MFYKIILSDRFQTASIIFLYALCIWMPAFLSPEIIYTGDENYMPFYRLTNRLFEGHILLSKLVSFGLMFFEAILLVRINIKFVLMQHKTFMPALFFVVLAGFNPILMQWNPVLPAALFVILVLDIIFRSCHNDPDSYSYFNAGILLGLGSLFYAPLIYLAGFIWLAIMVQRPFYWREYLFPILGILIPYIFVFAYLFIADQDITDFLLVLKSNFIIHPGFPKSHWIYWVFAGYLALLLAIANVFILRVFQFRKNYIRDYFLILFWLFIISSLLYIFISGYDIGITYLIAIPISFMFANYFINARKNTGNKMLLYMLLCYVLFMAFYKILGGVKFF